MNQILEMNLDIPNIPMVPPVRVINPIPPRFCLAREFWTALRRAPAVPTTRVPCAARARASFGSYGGGAIGVGLTVGVEEAAGYYGASRAFVEGV